MIFTLLIGGSVFVVLLSLIFEKLSPVVSLLTATSAFLIGIY